MKLWTELTPLETREAIARRLGCTHADAKRIASHLVEKYSTHGFVIDAQECEEIEEITPGEWFGLGLKVAEVPPETEKTLRSLAPFLDRLTVIGRLQEIKP